MLNTSNINIAKLLREVAAAYTIKKTGNIFEIRAYQNAADSIEHLTSEIKDLWEEGKLDTVPGLGKSIRGYLDELFKTREVKHFETVKKDIPEVVFEMLNIPGVGPKTASEIAKLGIKSLEDLKNQIKTGELVNKGFSAKIAEKIIQGLEEISSRNAGRMLLPYATTQANRILEYLKKSPDVVDAHPLGSLRRQVATIGDLDFSASSKEPQAVLEYFTKMPGISRVVNQGTDKATVVLNSGVSVDLLVGAPDSYGALLQHFTGGKNHNIKLRNYALDHGFSLSEDGIKILKSGKVVPMKTEEEFYKLLKMDVPPPEIREDGGEIEAALHSAQGKEPGLPNLVEFKDIKGDLHLHSNFPIENPSHGPGADSIEAIVKKAIELKYDYVGISDHPPGHGKAGSKKIIEWVQKRTKFIQEIQKSTKSVRVLNGLEIDILPDGSLSVPDEALELLDYCIAGIHSAHRGGQDLITKRLLAALASPHVDIISHPTNRLLNERESSDANWDEIFKIAAKNNKLLEINGYPNRLDLRDDLVREAKKIGVKFSIDSDAHALDQMHNIPFGIAVARRGWAEKEDIVNTWEWTEFKKWFKIN
jgi:DNA polymerase (family X)